MELEAGLIGLVVGAVASGGVQSYLARSDRRRNARNAARLLYMQLHEAESAVRDLRGRRDWENMITDWAVYGAARDRYSEQLAPALNTARFAVLSSAFGCIASLARSRERDMKQPPPTPGAPPNFDPTDELLALYVQTIERAKTIVLKASFQWWEIRTRKKALAR